MLHEKHHRMIRHNTRRRKSVTPACRRDSFVPVRQAADLPHSRTSDNICYVTMCLCGKTVQHACSCRRRRNQHRWGLSIYQGLPGGLEAESFTVSPQAGSGSKVPSPDRCRRRIASGPGLPAPVRYRPNVRSSAIFWPITSIDRLLTFGAYRISVLFSTSITYSKSMLTS